MACLKTNTALNKSSQSAMIVKRINVETRTHFNKRTSPAEEFNTGAKSEKPKE